MTTITTTNATVPTHGRDPKPSRDTGEDEKMALTAMAEAQAAERNRAHDIDPETLHHVREAVRSVLTSAPAYHALPDDVRRGIAHDMVAIGSYLVDGQRGHEPTATGLAAAQPPPDTAGSEFSRAGGAVAAGSGTAAFTQEVQQVNFPQFVKDLINGTFNAIVTASIQQMDAYANLLKNVTKSVDEYMRDNVTSNNARDYLAQQYPDHLEVDTSGESPVLKPKDGADEQTMPNFMKDLGLPQPVESLDQDSVEQTLVPAARQRMALDRQHLLATMVLMGINRLVVTEGDIEAKVLFQLDTQDKVAKSLKQTASFSDQYTYHKENSGWFSPTVNEDYTSSFNVTTTRSDSSTAQVDLHTKLSGQVSVHFKSETFPLDKMADIIGVDQIGGQAVGTGRNVAAQPAGVGSGPSPLAPQTLGSASQPAGAAAQPAQGAASTPR
jgi:hypothetical protein